MSTSLDSAAFSERLRGILRKRNLTRNQAAARLGIPGPQLSRYLNGQLPDLRTLFKLAQWSGQTMDWLLTGDQKEQQSLDPKKVFNDDILSFLQGKPPRAEEVEQIVKLLEHVDIDALVLLQTMLRALQPNAAHQNEAVALLEIMHELFELENQEMPVHVRSRRATKLLRHLEKLCLVKLPVEEAEKFWDELGQYLYDRMGFDLLPVEYGPYAHQVADRYKNDRYDKLFAAEKEIREILQNVKKHPETVEQACQQLVRIGETFPRSPIVASRASWRKSSNLRENLLKLVSRASTMPSKGETWQSYCIEIRFQVIGD